MFSSAEVKAILDAAFSRLEAASPSLWEKMAEKVANATIDNSPVPQWVADELNKLVGAKQKA